MTAPAPVRPLFPGHVLGADTSYTLWSKDRLLGQTELDYARCFAKVRIGDFEATEVGETLMPMLTGVRRALLELAKASADGRDPHGTPGGAGGRADAIRRTSQFADVEAAKAQFESLALELRAPDGSIVPTESIDVSDNEFTLSLARDDDYLPPDPLVADTEEEKRLIESIEHDAALLEEWFGPDWDGDDIKPWQEQPSFPRYQIHVELLDDATIP